MGTDPESISSPKSFPQWMRSKIENRLDDNVPFSPPAHDDSFFYIRYPAGGGSAAGGPGGSRGNEKMSISDQIRASMGNQIQGGAAGGGSGLPIGHISAAVKEMTLEQQAAAAQAKVDLSKHTEPCRQYLAGANNKTTLLPGQKKSLGIDDGFKGAGAACGSSVVRVAHQMVNLNRPFTRGFTVASFDEADSEVEVSGSKSIRGRSADPKTAGIVAEELQAAGVKPELNMMRRGSKSLPASPMGSPKAVRKNPYFTGIFTASQNNSNSEHTRGWLLSSLLGIQRESIQSTASSTTNIAEETEHETMEYEARGVAFGGQQTPTAAERPSPITSVFRATKPSEIREMNFWSPTSM